MGTASSTAPLASACAGENGFALENWRRVLCLPINRGGAGCHRHRAMPIGFWLADEAAVVVGHDSQIARPRELRAQAERRAVESRDEKRSAAVHPQELLCSIRLGQHRASASFCTKGSSVRAWSTPRHPPAAEAARREFTAQLRLRSATTGYQRG